MDIATGAIRLVLPKLAKLATDEFKLLAEARGDIAFLQSELEPMKAFLLKVAEVPADELDQQVKIWSRDVRELSYDIEDKIDDFTVRVDRGLTPKEARGFKEFITWSKNSVATAGARHRIAKEMKGIKKDVVEVAQRHERYKLGDAVSRPSRVSVDPRMLALYQETAQLVGVEAPRDDIVRMLEASQRQLKIISIVGFGGLGKTALAKVVYDMFRGYYECHAFVSVSLKPDMKKMLREMLHKLSKIQYAHIESWDERQLIDELREFLKDKRSKQGRGGTASSWGSMGLLPPWRTASTLLRILPKHRLENSPDLPRFATTGLLHILPSALSWAFYGSSLELNADVRSGGAVVVAETTTTTSQAMVRARNGRCKTW